MMKKLLVLLLSAMMVFSLAACGDDTADGDDQQIENNDADANDDEESGYTAEQAACVEKYEQMLEDYQAAIDLANATPELNQDTDLADLINEVTDAINIITDKMADPANMTEEFVTGVYDVIDNAYIIINRIDTYAELLPILTYAFAGVDEEDNTYWFACDDNEEVGAMVILSADQTQNVYCIGDMVCDENGIYTINDEEGYTMSMSVEAVEEDGVSGLLVTLQDGTQVGMVPAMPREVIEVMLTIQETTENVNE